MHDAVLKALISIHSPLRGETWMPEFAQKMMRYFNPLASERRDLKKSLQSTSYRYFNPLASERRDSVSQEQVERVWNFNPLASERRDLNSAF